uniref:Tr-type G domain-containing protein n=1 Tax=Brassica oleracea var. oleracea TaxID=109376 RepID=A0A0D3A5V4_BRAOL
MYCCIMHGRLMDQKILDGNTEVAPVATRVHVNGLKERLRGVSIEKFYINIVVVDQDDSGKSTDTGHLIDKLHGLGSFRPPSTTALSLLLLNILISSRTWLVVPPRMIVLFLSLTPPLVVSKLVSLRMDRPMSTLSLLHP